ncbi:MAG TPA: NAD(P)-dependent oxidoreductase [Solirubrobacteraceae bacterium]|nr:NAD(P)-dependent oxidoreductase [Solirubrobacteraceae bacterium]
MTGTVGIIGIGRMGLPVCARLTAAGLRVVAGDVRPEREQDARDAGAGWDPDPERLVGQASVLITVLPGSGELVDAMAVALGSLRPNSTWIDLTSAAPAAGMELVARAHARGIECLEAPMGGGVHAATTGTLQLFVGGRSDVVERHRALLELLGRVEHVGDHGAGYTTKLLVNLLWFGQAVAVGEALLLARRAEIDLDVLRSALGRSAAASDFVSRDLDRLLDGDYLESFGIDRCCEELAAVAALADELDVPFELSSTVERAYRAALTRYGPVDGELLAVALLEERAGTRLRRSAAS